MSLSRYDLDKEKAKADCKKYGTPTPGVDHSSHYKPIKGGSPMNEAELMQHMAKGGYRVHQEWGLMLPASPPVDKQPAVKQLGPCTSRGPDEPVERSNVHAEHNRFCTESTPCQECHEIIEKAEGFEGTETNPMPLGGE